MTQKKINIDHSNVHIIEISPGKYEGKKRKVALKKKQKIVQRCPIPVSLDEEPPAEDVQALQRWLQTGLLKKVKGLSRYRLKQKFFFFTCSSI